VALKRPEFSFTTTMAGIVGPTYRFLYFVFWKKEYKLVIKKKQDCRVAGNLVIVKKRSVV